MSQQKAFQHMVAWTMQNLFNTYKEAQEILADEKLTEAEKAVKIKGPWGTDHRMINLSLCLKPALEEAEKEFPEHGEAFFAWFKERWDVIEKANVLEGKCGCKGCKVEETTKEEAPIN